MLRMATVEDNKSISANVIEELQLWSSGNSCLRLDYTAQKLYIDGAEVKLTLSEWKLITYLISNAHVVLSREQILASSLGYSFEGYNRIVDTHIKNVRAKLGSEKWIETVWGVGYFFCGDICR